jgi:tungstate transport system ATP-binding protein
MSRPILEIKNLTVEYQGTAVLQIGHLAVQARETLTLLGPNGAGKSTLLKVLGLLESPTRGEVWFDGEPVSYRPKSLLALRRRMATVFQEPLLCDATVNQNVILGLKLRGLPAAEISRRAEHWMKRLGIAHLRQRRARTLSAGEAQRTSLARAFVLEPSVLLLDEPFGTLDPPLRETLLSEFQEILAEANTATLFVTHDRTEALTLGDRVAVLFKGKLAHVGTPEEVFSQPATEDVARFVGVETTLPGRVVSCSDGLAVVDVGAGTVEVRGDSSGGDAVLVCLRPEDITLLGEEERPRTSARNTFEGRIVKAVPLGPLVRVVVDCGVPIVALVTKLSFQEMGLSVGGKIHVSFKSTAAHMIRRRDARDVPPNLGSARVS